VVAVSKMWKCLRLAVHQPPTPLYYLQMASQTEVVKWLMEAVKSWRFSTELTFSRRAQVFGNRSAETQFGLLSRATVQARANVQSRATV